MSTYVLIATIGYAFMAAVVIIDKFILSKKLEPLSFAFFTTIFFFGSFLLLPFSEPISLYGFFMALISGLSFGFGTLAMYLGLRHGEATHVVPFIGAVTAVFVYGFSATLLGELLSPHATLGIGFLILATLLFSYEKVKGKVAQRGMHKSFLWALFSGVLFAMSHISAKLFYEDFSFITGLVWTKGFVGIVALLLLFAPSVRRDFFKKSDSKHSLWIVWGNQVLGIIGTVAIQYAISIGSVAIVSGLVGLQYALILAFAFISTIFVPRFFSEYLTKKEVSAELTAIVLVVAGFFLLI